MKTCYHCKQQLPLDRFGPRPANRDGLSNLCKACNVQRMQEYRQTPRGRVSVVESQRSTRRKKQTIIDAYKEEHGCRYCGVKVAGVLDFHHRDPAEKVAPVARLISNGHSLDAIWDEIAKCDVVCKNCHILVHGKTIITGHQP